METTFVIDTLEQFKALAHPLRQKIFERLAIKERTTKQVAQELGEKPTRLYHHVAALERAGLIRLMRTEPVRGATAKYYQAVARSLTVDPSLFSEEEGAAALEQSGAGLVHGIVTNLGRDLTALMNDTDAEAGPHEEAFVAQLEIFGDQATLQKTRDRLQVLLVELQSESADEDPAGDAAESRRLILAWYPPPENSKKRKDS